MTYLFSNFKLKKKKNPLKWTLMRSEYKNSKKPPGLEQAIMHLEHKIIWENITLKLRSSKQLLFFSFLIDNI
jgi:hypothetical protein